MPRHIGAWLLMALLLTAAAVLACVPQCRFVAVEGLELMLPGVVRSSALVSRGRGRVVDVRQDAYVGDGRGGGIDGVDGVAGGGDAVGRFPRVPLAGVWVV